MKTILRLLALLSLLGCSSSPFKKEAIVLNNNATQLFLTNPDSALILFDRAIALDSSYHLPIQNKANLLIHQRRYEEALLAVEQLLTKEEYPEALQIRGMLIDKLGTSATDAQHAYRKALAHQQERLATFPEDKKLSENVSLSMTYFLLGDTTQAKKIIQENKTKGNNLAIGDSILKYLDNKPRIIDLILKSN